MPTVAEQLASVWNYISGAGVLVEDHRIAVWRDGRFHYYSAPEGIDEIGFFRLGEGLWLYATQACVLTHREMTTPLYAGWNNIAWLVDEGEWPPALPPPAWMGVLVPVLGIVMVGAVPIKRLFKDE